MIVLALVLGAAWRRWWGDERPAWALPGFRSVQAVVGFAALFGVCLLAGHPLWESALRSALALAFLTTMAESIPHIWRFWEWLDDRWSTRSRFPLLDGYTTKAELTCGALVWGVAISI